MILENSMTESNREDYAVTKSNATSTDVVILNLCRVQINAYSGVRQSSRDMQRELYHSTLLHLA